MTNKNNKIGSQFIYAVLVVLTAIFIFPIFLVLMNSFKSRLYVSTVPFALPSGNMFVGLENYINGLTTSGFFMAFLRSVWVSIASVALIIVGTSMTAWFIVRVKTKLTNKAVALPIELRRHIIVERAVSITRICVGLQRTFIEYF